MSSTVSIWSILIVTNLSGHTLLIGSFGATAVLLFAVPDAPLSQPRNLIGGHILSACIAVILVYTIGTNFFTIGLSVGLSILVMYLTHTLHPPGGATALIGVIGGVGVDFIFFPVMLGVIVLLCNALIVNNLVHHRKYPVAWF
ncbi:HPP family protein [Leptospira bouyouniensis]|uniref:HPP family protein n=1 Tax=Leptospira bouyouniensis TaxID=2484911 RepID=A0ABY2L294_9LEPT|nr:HPP family protein [Leptospira bouyouniensis]